MSKRLDVEGVLATIAMVGLTVVIIYIIWRF